MVAVRLVLILTIVGCITTFISQGAEIRRLNQHLKAVKVLLKNARNTTHTNAQTLVNELQEASQIIQTYENQNHHIDADREMPNESHVLEPKTHAPVSDPVKLSSGTVYSTSMTDRPRTFSRLTTNRQMKLGAFVFLLGLIWGVSYAFANNRISPLWRIILGYGLGLGIIGLGVTRLKTSYDQGSVLVALGAICAVASAYTGMIAYEFATLVQVFILSLVPIGFASAIAVRHESKNLAIMSLCLGLIAPWFVGVGQSWMSILGYLFVLYVGVVIQLSHRPDRNILRVISLAGYALYTIVLLVGGSVSGSPIGFLLPTIIFLLFFVVQLTGLITTQSSSKIGNVIYPILNAGLYLRRIPNVTADQHISLVLVFVTLLFGTVVYLLIQQFEVSKRSSSLWTYVGLTVVFLGLALAYELSGPVLVVSYLLQITVLILGVLWLAKRSGLALSLGVLYSIPLILGIDAWSASSWNTGRVHSDMVIVGGFVIISILLVRLFDKYFVDDNKNLHHSGLQSFHTLYFVASVFSGLVAIGLMSKVLDGMISDITAVGGQYLLVRGLSMYALTQQKRQRSQILLIGLLPLGLWSVVVIGQYESLISFSGITLIIIGYLRIGKSHTQYLDQYKSTSASGLMFRTPMLPVLLSIIGVIRGGHMIVDTLGVVSPLMTQSVIISLLVGIIARWTSASKDQGVQTLGVLAVIVVGCYIMRIITTGIGAEVLDGGGLMTLIYLLVFSLWVARYLSTHVDTSETNQLLIASQYLIATGLGMRLIRNISEMIAHDDQMANMVSLVVYIMGSIYAYITATNRAMSRLKWCAGLITIGVVLNLLLVQVRVMSLGRRIVTFLAVGVVLIGSAYFHRSVETTTDHD